MFKQPLTASTVKTILPLLFLSAFAHAQVTRMPVSFTYTKVTAYSHQFSDAFSFGSNQGALAGTKTFSAGVYSERRFLLKALSAYSAAFALPTASGNFGLKADYFGEQAYNESSIGLAYARLLSDKVAVGVQFNYTGLKAAGYGSAATLNFDAGALFQLTPQLNAGLHVYNPVGKNWGKDGTERLPAIYTVGLGYDASPQVFIGAEIEKVEDQPVGVNAGLHYQLADKLIARIGFQSSTSVYYFGLGVQVKNFRFDVTASLHPYLGLTPGLLLLYASKE
jgi:uncharacterized membrane protein